MARSNSLLRLLAPIIRPIYGGMGLILMFHRVIPVENRPRVSGRSVLEVTPGTLEEIITFFLGQDYTALSIEEVYHTLTVGEKPDRRFVVYSFDDGYRDNLTYAYPIFKRHKVPFTVYVSTCFPERTAVLWWYVLEDLVLAKARIEFAFANRAYRLSCETASEKSSVFSQLRQMFKYANVEQRAALTQSVLVGNQLSLTTKAEELALSWEQLRQLAEDPLVTIGAHTVNHYALKGLTEPEALYEIAESKAVLEARLARPVEHFAYPFGHRREAGEREFALARRAGFKTAVTTRAGNIFPAHAAGLMSLPRHDTAGVPDLPGDLNLVTCGAWNLWKNRFQRVVME